MTSPMDRERQRLASLRQAREARDNARAEAEAFPPGIVVPTVPTLPEFLDESGRPYVMRPFPWVPISGLLRLTDDIRFLSMPDVKARHIPKPFVPGAKLRRCPGIKANGYSRIGACDNAATVDTKVNGRRLVLCPICIRIAFPTKLGSGARGQTGMCECGNPGVKRARISRVVRGEDIPTLGIRTENGARRQYLLPEDSAETRVIAGFGLLCEDCLADHAKRVRIRKAETPTPEILAREAEWAALSGAIQSMIRDHIETVLWQMLPDAIDEVTNPPTYPEEVIPEDETPEERQARESALVLSGLRGERISPEKIRALRARTSETFASLISNLEIWDRTREATLGECVSRVVRAGLPPQMMECATSGAYDSAEFSALLRAWVRAVLRDGIRPRDTSGRKRQSSGLFFMHREAGFLPLSLVLVRNAEAARDNLGRDNRRSRIVSVDKIGNDGALLVKASGSDEISVHSARQFGGVILGGWEIISRPEYVLPIVENGRLEWVTVRTDALCPDGTRGLRRDALARLRPWDRKILASLILGDEAPDGRTTEGREARDSAGAYIRACDSIDRQTVAVIETEALSSVAVLSRPAAYSIRTREIVRRAPSAMARREAKIRVQSIRARQAYRPVDERPSGSPAPGQRLQRATGACRPAEAPDGYTVPNVMIMRPAQDEAARVTLTEAEMRERERQAEMRLARNARARERRAARKAAGAGL